MQGRLQLAENRADDLTESLNATTAAMEQYRAIVRSLEESLDKEKEVQKHSLHVCLPPCSFGD